MDRWTKAGKELKEFVNKNENQILNVNNENMNKNNFTDTRPKLPIIENNLENDDLDFANHLQVGNTSSEFVNSNYNDIKEMILK